MSLQYQYYEFYLYPRDINFQESKYIEFLTTRKLWRYGFRIDGAFWFGLEYKGQSLINNRTAIKFETTSKRTYADDVLIRFELLTRCLEILLDCKEKLELYSPVNRLYEDTKLPKKVSFPLRNEKLKKMVYPLEFRDTEITTILGFCLEELYNWNQDGTLETYLLLDDIKFPQLLHFYDFFDILDDNIDYDTRKFIEKLKNSLPESNIPHSAFSSLSSKRTIEIQTQLCKTKVVEC